MSTIPDTPLSEWVRADYKMVHTPTGAKVPAIPAPAISINVKNPDAVRAGNGGIVRAVGLLDTGACASAMPLWAIEHAGIEFDERSKRPAFSASGRFDAYHVEVGMEMWIGNGWFDAGIIEVMAPDTVASRTPGSHMPFLLGRHGFFDRFSACFDEQEQAFWLRRAGGSVATGAAAPRR